MRKTHLFWVSLFFAFAFVMVSCQNDPDNSTGNRKSTSTVFIASTDLSDFTEESIKKAGLVETFDLNSVPDVFVYNPNEGPIDDDALLLAIETSLFSGTVIIDNPTAQDLIDFSSKLNECLEQEENEYTRDLCDVSEYSLTQFFSDARLTYLEGLENKDTAKYEILAIREDDAYYVHPIRDIESGFSKTTTGAGSGDEITLTFDENGEVIDEVKVDNQTSDYDNTLSDDEYERIRADAIEDFAAWITAEEEEASRSAEGASGSSPQTFVHNFTVVFSKDNVPHYDGRYNGRAETVQLKTSVWAACKIEDKADYYLVRNTATCHNEELKYQRDWNTEEGYYLVGPHMDYCKVWCHLGNEDGLRGLLSPNPEEGYSPKASKGKVENVWPVTKQLDLSGEVGFCKRGLDGGSSSGFSHLENIISEIPDTEVFFETDGCNATWEFKGPELKLNKNLLAKVGIIGPTCDDPAPIQTQTAIFDTLALYVMPSDKYVDNCQVPLSTECQISIRMLTLWRDSLLRYAYKTPYQFVAKYDVEFIKKPNNAYGNYDWTFEAPAGCTEEQIKEFKEAFTKLGANFNESVKIYGVRDISTTDYAPIDKVAHDTGVAFRKKLASSGLAGQFVKKYNLPQGFKFKIVNHDSKKQVYTLEIPYIEQD